MPLNDWFKQKRDKQLQQVAHQSGCETLSEEELEKLWKTCVSCNTQLPVADYEANMMVCPKCNYHYRIDIETRLSQLVDGFEAMYADLTAANPLEFDDLEPYTQRLASAKKKTQRNEAVATGKANIEDTYFALALMDFDFMGGSMGSVVGEKITRLIEYALQEELPLVVLTSSGGARMQEGIFSLMQMAKTGAALAKFHEAGLLYITVCTEPTFGGVTASFGTLGDIILAEDGARIGFAGRRVIEQTIRQKLPPEFQTADYLKQYGQIDQVVSRFELKERLKQFIDLHNKAVTCSGRYEQRRLG